MGSWKTRWALCQGLAVGLFDRRSLLDKKPGVSTRGAGGAKRPIEVKIPKAQLARTMLLAAVAVGVAAWAISHTIGYKPRPMFVPVPSATASGDGELQWIDLQER